MALVQSGLDVLISCDRWQKELEGNVSYLCHSASITSDISPGLQCLREILGDRLVSLMGPQHGLVTDVQDNMVESDCYFDDYFGLPFYSLYGKVRSPGDEALKGVNTVVVDLQDVGSRVYTYISTLGLVMRSCAARGIKVVVLDRPNPIGGDTIEGNVLEPKWHSFVGHSVIPMRHGMTMGEMGNFIKESEGLDLDYSVVTMEGWKRSYYWRDTGLPWVNPSPNLSTPDSAITFCGTVLFEGTNMSEGRGTTRALEVVGAPGIEPYSFWEEVSPEFTSWGFGGVVLRPTRFLPTFQKYKGVSCGGFHIHVTDPSQFLSWRMGQWLLSKFYGIWKEFVWYDRPYEYEYDGLAIDFINGSDAPRLWCENDASLSGLEKLEQVGKPEFESLRDKCLLYQ